MQQEQTDARYNGQWHQIGGDVSASEESAIFARVEGDTVYMVGVEWLPMLHRSNPYYVTEYEYDARDFMHLIEDGTWDSAVRSACYSKDYMWDSIDACYTLFGYGVCDPRQPSTWFDKYGSCMPTLRAVMDDYGIPARALWLESEYNEPAPKVYDGEY